MTNFVHAAPGTVAWFEDDPGRIAFRVLRFPGFAA